MKPAPPLDLTSATDAAGRLGIGRASLYAYVSRGLIRSFASPHDPRQRLYALDDIEVLVKRRARLRRPTVAAATALDWGLPVLETSITQVQNGRLFYRGQDAVTLSAHATLEETARLLIGGLDRDPFADPPMALAQQATMPFFGARAFVSEAIRLLTTVPDEAQASASIETILRLVTAAASGSAPMREPIHRHLARTWAADERAGDVIRRALVLSADHELSASAFAVRVVASTGASLAQAAIAGLAALSGPRHGGMIDEVRALLQDHEKPGGAKRLGLVLRNRDAIASFSHPLYPQGDPRGAALLEDLPLKPCDARFLRRIEQAGGRASIDLALVMGERSLSLPEGAAFAIFAIGRTAGWLAHAMEQRTQATLIRPRARYSVPSSPGRG
jgi:citrate synthase